MFLVRKRHIDPSTGDEVSRSEKASLVVQGFMRNWAFVFVVLGITAVWWTMPAVFGDNHSYIKFQLVYSSAAIIIELLLGIGMFGWARRDSQFIRKLYALERAAEHQAEADQALMHLIAKNTEALLTLERGQLKTDKARVEALAQQHSVAKQQVAQLEAMLSEAKAQADKTAAQVEATETVLNGD